MVTKISKGLLKNLNSAGQCNLGMITSPDKELILATKEEYRRGYFKVIDQGQELGTIAVKDYEAAKKEVYRKPLAYFAQVVNMLWVALLFFKTTLIITSLTYFGFLMVCLFYFPEIRKIPLGNAFNIEFIKLLWAFTTAALGVVCVTKKDIPGYKNAFNRRTLKILDKLVPGLSLLNGCKLQWEESQP